MDAKSVDAQNADSRVSEIMCGVFCCLSVLVGDTKEKTREQCIYSFTCHFDRPGIRNSTVLKRRLEGLIRNETQVSRNCQISVVAAP